MTDKIKSYELFVNDVKSKNIKMKDSVIKRVYNDMLNAGLNHNVWNKNLINTTI